VGHSEGRQGQAPDTGHRLVADHIDEAAADCNQAAHWEMVEADIARHLPQGRSTTFHP
jgi:hypothetical protein